MPVEVWSPPRGHSMNNETMAGLAGAIRAKQLSPVEAVQGYLDRIVEREPTLRDFISVHAQGARARALEQEAPRGPLHGVPLAYKDLCAIKGLPTSCGAKTPDYFFSPRDCTAVTRLTRAGAITLGKLNMSELAMGPFGDNAHHGDAQNPWRVGPRPGGACGESVGPGAARRL